MQQFDIIPYESDHWAKGGEVVATVEAETALSAARKWAKAKGYKLDEKLYYKGDPNRQVVGVYDETLPAKDIDQSMTPYSKGKSYDLWAKVRTGYRIPGVRRKARWVPCPARVTVTSYPYMLPAPYAGPITFHGSDRDAIKAAFKELRREGIAARQSYKCCMSCATAAAPGDKPFVYYHQQDAAAWRERARYGWGSTGPRQPDLQSDLCIRYCAPDGFDVREVGVKAMQAFERNGLVVEWDGDPSSVITIKALSFDEHFARKSGIEVTA